MIEIITNAKEVANWVSHLKTNIERSQGTLTRKVTEATRMQVKTQAPAWRHILCNRVAMLIFPKNHRGEVFMMSPQDNQIALENEYNISGKRKVYKYTDKKLAEWANEKNVFTDKPYVIVGGRNTRLGRQNMFFYPAFINVQSQIPTIASNVIVEAIMKTKG